ncbi:MAG: hypothetical protein IKH86_03095 [Prevotella sp.]|nr:hypothetical protein [Prevotella sp.]
MQDLNTIPSVGTFGEVARNANTNFSLLKIAVDLLEHSIEHSRGYFTSASALTTAFPSPAVGDWAIVEVSGTPTIYKCSTRGTWSNSGTQWAGGSVDLTEYLKKGTGDAQAVSGSNNWITSGAVFQTADKLSKDIAQITGGFVAVDLSNLEASSVVIPSGTNPSWTNSSVAQAVFIPVVSGSKIRLTGASHVTYYAFLANDTHTVGETVVFAGSASERSSLSVNTVRTVTVPEDATCLHIFTKTSSGNLVRLGLTVEISTDSPFVKKEERDTYPQVGSKNYPESGGLANLLGKLINLQTTLTAGSIIRTDGSAGNTHYRTPFIPINEGESVYAQVLNTSYTAGVAFYTEEKASSYVGASPEGSNTVFVPADYIAELGAKFFRCSIHNDQMASGEWFICKSSINSLQNKIEAVDQKCDIKINGPVRSKMKIMNTGSVESATTAAANRTLIYDVSDLVGETIKIHGLLYASAYGNSYCWWAIHDEEGSVLDKSETSGSSTTIKDAVITIPAGGAVLYVQGSKTDNIDYLPFIFLPINKYIGGKNEDQKTTRKKFDLDFSILNSNGNILANSSFTNCANRHTVDFIRVYKTITIHNLDGMKTPLRVFFFDENFSCLTYTTYEDANGLDTLSVEIPAGAVWFRLSMHLNNSDYNAETSVYYKKNYIEISSEWQGNDTIKEPYQEYIPFLYSVKVNVPCKITNNPSVTTKTMFGYDEGLLHLPSSYTNNGAPTPVIFFIHGDAERYGIGESSFSGHMKMQQCWSDAGFAQVDLDLIPSIYKQNSLASSGGTRDDLECLSAAWTWLCNHYNVDKKGFYLIGRSRGGQCVLEVLAKGAAVKLPVIAAVSMAGANSVFEYCLASPANRTEGQWQMWCNARGLPSDGRPSWADSPIYAVNGRSFLEDANLYNFIVANWEIWWRKALTGWGLITHNPDNITPKDFFDNFIYPYVMNNNKLNPAINEFFQRMVDTMEMISPVPLRFDWCVGDQTQKYLPFSGTRSYSATVVEIMIKTVASNACYRQWDSVDETNPYGETNPHYAENMIFYEGDVVLPNGAVTHNPSKVTLEWLIWCMGHDPRYQTTNTNYTLPWEE